jgi:hypothetical protein
MMIALCFAASGTPLPAPGNWKSFSILKYAGKKNTIFEN